MRTILSTVVIVATDNADVVQVLLSLNILLEQILFASIWVDLNLAQVGFRPDFRGSSHVKGTSVDRNQ